MGERITTWTPMLITNDFQITASIEGEYDVKSLPKAQEKVQPLGDIETIKRFKEYFLNRPERYAGINIRNLTLFVYGINVGRRCTDLTSTRFIDVVDFENMIIVDFHIFKESKTDKLIKVYFNDAVKAALADYINSFDSFRPEDYLFTGYKDKSKPLSTKAFLRFMKEAAEELGIEYRVGTHTMRKTCATFAMRFAPESDQSIAEVVVSKQMLGHAKIADSRRYTGVDDKRLKTFYNSLNL